MTRIVSSRSEEWSGACRYISWMLSTWSLFKQVSTWSINQSISGACRYISWILSTFSSRYPPDLIWSDLINQSINQSINQPIISWACRYIRYKNFKPFKAGIHLINQSIYQYQEHADTSAGYCQPATFSSRYPPDQSINQYQEHADTSAGYCEPEAFSSRYPPDQSINQSITINQ